MHGIGEIQPPGLEWARLYMLHKISTQEGAATQNNNFQWPTINCTLRRYSESPCRNDNEEKYCMRNVDYQGYQRVVVGSEGEARLC